MSLILPSACCLFSRLELLHVFHHLCFLLLNSVKVFQDEETGEDAVFEMWMISELHTDVTVLSILFCISFQLCILSILRSQSHDSTCSKDILSFRDSAKNVFAFCVKLRLFFPSSFFPCWISFAVLLAMSCSLPAVLSKQFAPTSTHDLVFTIFSTLSELKPTEPGADLVETQFLS